MSRSKNSWVYVLSCLAMATSASLAADIDSDGVPDNLDVCCNTPTGIGVDGTGRPIGDLDFDCDVDLADFAILAAHLTGPLAPVSCPPCYNGQLDGDETDVDCGGSCPPCANGFDCLTSSDCASTFCVDLVCCNIACNFLCQSCDLPGSPGLCANIPNGSDPDNECAGTTTCDGAGACTTLLPNGSACASGSQCVSGNCVDGVCCNTICGALCQACNNPGFIGTCSNVPNGTDPASECAGATNCNGAGACTTLLPNGSSCSLGTQCSSGLCVDGVCCNGSCAGLCQACNNAGSVGTCSNIPNGTDPANECAGSITCNGAGGCATLANGSACTTGSQCTSGSCVDSVCCNSSCAGLCKACNVAGSEGTCSNVPNGTDPANECAGASTCNGAGSCGP